MAKQQKSSTVSEAALKAALRRRIRGLYRSFDLGSWDRCFQYLDPRLREAGKVEQSRYSASLNAFKERYGAIAIWHVRISFHSDVRTNKHDDRPFAYAYVIWQDSQNEVHLFRERWVFDSGRWYTRVVGLVTHEKTNARQE
jgi:hypothetical protein